LFSETDGDQIEDDDEDEYENENLCIVV